MQGNTIGDMLDMGLDEVDWPHDFDFDEEDYDEHTRHDRSIAFDILWDETGTYPPELDEDVVYALIDEDDHKYRISVNDQERDVGATGLALMAYLDDDASVEVIEHE